MLLDNALMEVVGNICAFAVTNQSTSIGRTKGCLKLNVSFGHLSLSCICSGPSVYLSIIIISYTNTEVIVMKILFFKNTPKTNMVPPPPPTAPHSLEGNLNFSLINLKTKHFVVVVV